MPGSHVPFEGPLAVWNRPLFAVPTPVQPWPKNGTPSVILAAGAPASSNAFTESTMS